MNPKPDNILAEVAALRCGTDGWKPDSERGVESQREPMGLADNLLSHLAQECCEVAIRCTKAQHFGLNEIQPEQSLTNAQRIAEELSDVFAIADELQKRGLIPTFSERDAAARLSAKQRKASGFRDYSSELGRLVTEKP